MAEAVQNLLSQGWAVQVPSKQGDYCQGVPQLLGSTHKELQLQPLENRGFEEGFFP